jgi:hypothetical protein
MEARSIPVGALVTEGWYLHPYQIIWPVHAALNGIPILAPGTSPSK